MTVLKANEGMTELEKYEFFAGECKKRYKRAKGALKDFYFNALAGFQIKIVQKRAYNAGSN